MSAREYRNENFICKHDSISVLNRAVLRSRICPVCNSCYFDSGPAFSEPCVSAANCLF